MCDSQLFNAHTVLLPLNHSLPAVAIGVPGVGGGYWPPPPFEGVKKSLLNHGLEKGREKREETNFMRSQELLDERKKEVIV